MTCEEFVVVSNSGVPLECVKRGESEHMRQVRPAAGMAGRSDQKDAGQTQPNKTSGFAFAPRLSDHRPHRGRVALVAPMSAEFMTCRWMSAPFRKIFVSFSLWSS
jgi:hypothetical protein